MSETTEASEKRSGEAISGFGFIRGDDGREFYFNQKETGGMTLDARTRVQFEPMQNPNNPDRWRAKKVRKV